MSIQTFVGAKDLRSIAGGEGHGVARRDERAAGNATNHIRADSRLTASALTAYMLHVFHRRAQVCAQTGDGLHYIHDETEDEQNQDAFDDKTQRLPPLFGLRIFRFFRAMIEHRLRSGANIRLASASRIQILAGAGDYIRADRAAGFQRAQQLFRFIQRGDRRAGAGHGVNEGGPLGVPA